jgi:spermidine synthase
MTTGLRGALPARSSARFFYTGVFLMSACTLILQVVQTRILSVVAWYHLAFFVISMAMFGLTAGAVWVYLMRDRFSERTLSDDLAYVGAAFSAATFGSLLLQMTLAPVLAFNATAVVIWVLLALCMAVPFFFSGVFMSLALTRSPFPVGRVYGIDLIGAAMGCLSALALLNLTDAPSAVLWVSVLGIVATICVARARVGGPAQHKLPMANVLGMHGTILVLLLVCAIANSMTDRGLRPIFVKGKVESAGRMERSAASDQVLLQRWNSFSRVALFDIGLSLPKMWGPSEKFTPGAWQLEQLALNIDGDAGTNFYRLQGDVSKAGFLKYDVTNLAYYLPERERAAIIGVGGGRDMLSARVFGVNDVTGVEINPILVNLLVRDPRYADYVGLNTIPQMRIETDEARSWFARSTEEFDVIQMSLIDTWAATGAGAFTLSENGLYTVEAWEIFMRHLSEKGVFTVSRWYAAGEVNETGRMVSLAVASLFAMGAPEPRKNIFLATSQNVATLIVSRQPFSDSAVNQLQQVAGELKYTVLISPATDSPSPVLKQIVSSQNPQVLKEYTRTLPLDLTPAYDDRPFFFNQLPLTSLFRMFRMASAPGEAGVARGNLAATSTLAMLFIISLLLVLGTILLPLRSAMKDVGKRLAVGGTAYFMLIGVGFMTIEIALLQRMSVFLGHPVYSLSIVLFSIILSTGLGSVISDRFPLNTSGKLVLWAALTGAYFLLLPLFLPGITLAFDGASLPMRALWSVLLIAPGGMLMGWGFPTGMRLVARVDGKPTPWFWGVNGASGVLASSMAVGISIALGITATMVIGALCYLALIPAALAMYAEGTKAYRKAA